MFKIVGKKLGSWNEMSFSEKKNLTFLSVTCENGPVRNPLYFIIKL